MRIDSNHQIGVIAQNYQQQPYGYYQPTFLYESIWDLGTALALILLDRKYKLGHGRVFALYLVIYGLGRSWIEALRIDPAHHFYGLRLNDWTSIVIVVSGVLGFLISAKLRPGRETSLLRKPPSPDVDGDAPIATATDADRRAARSGRRVGRRPPARRRRRKQRAMTSTRHAADRSRGLRCITTTATSPAAGCAQRCSARWTVSSRTSH